MPSTKERLRKLREKYHLGEYRLTKRKAHKKRVSHKTRRVHFMARRKHSSRKSRGIIHKGSLMTGIAKPAGILGAIILGAGAATLVENAGLANTIPFGKYVAGGAVGGLGGVVGVFARDMLKGQSPTGSSSVGSVY